MSRDPSAKNAQVFFHNVRSGMERCAQDPARFEAVSNAGEAFINFCPISSASEPSPVRVPVASFVAELQSALLSSSAFYLALGSPDNS